MVFIAARTSTSGKSTIKNIGFFDNVIGVSVQCRGDGNIVRSNHAEEGPIFCEVTSGSDRNTIEGNDAPTGVIEMASADRNIVAHNQVKDIYATDCERNTIGPNRVYLSPTHGIHLNDSSDNQVSGNYVDSAGQTADDTYDGIYIDGNSDRNKITENIVRYDPTTKTRYGVNISAATCDENLVDGNDLLNSGATAEYNNDGTNTRGTQGSGGPAGVTQVPTLVDREAMFFHPGVLTTVIDPDWAGVSEGTQRIYNQTGKTRTIVGVSISVGIAPTGATVIVDINKDGTSIYPTATKPTIAASGFVSPLAVPDTTAWADGSYLTFDIDQIGSIIAGADLTVIILWKET
jgi:parallel beta-helix repeat protein